VLAFQRTEKIRTTATVDSVDAAARKVTLTGAAGKETVTVPADVANLNDIKAGDKIVVDYYRKARPQNRKPTDPPLPIEVVRCSTRARRARRRRAWPP